MHFSPSCAQPKWREERVRGTFAITFDYARNAIRVRVPKDASKDAGMRARTHTKTGDVIKLTK